MHRINLKATYNASQAVKAVAISISLAFLLYISFAICLDLYQLANRIQTIHSQTWVILIALTFISSCLRFIRWESYLTAYQVSIPRAKNFLIYFSGFALITTPASIGENIRSIFMAEYQLSFPDCLALFIAERLIDIVAMLLIIFVAAATAAHLHIAWGSALILLGSLGVLYSPLLRELLRKIKNVRILRVLESLSSLAPGRLSTQPLTIAGITTLAAWCLQGLGLALILQSMGAELTPILAIGIYAASVLLGSFSFIPGGLGATEVIMAVLLTELLGVEPNTAMAAAIVSRITTIWVAVTYGISALAVLRAKTS